MPGINLVTLVEYLNDIQMRLYDVYVEERNFDLADAILRIRDRLVVIIKTLESVVIIDSK
jgi:hypothetical protein